MSNESCDTCKPQTGDVDTTLINETGEQPDSSESGTGTGTNLVSQTPAATSESGTGTGTNLVPQTPATTSESGTGTGTNLVPQTPATTSESGTGTGTNLVPQTPATTSESGTGTRTNLVPQTPATTSKSGTETPNTSANKLALLLENLADKDISVRRSIAQNPNTRPDILKKLSTDENYYVQRDVAENPNTPVDILKKLLNILRKSTPSEPRTEIGTETEISSEVQLDLFSSLESTIPEDLTPQNLDNENDDSNNIIYTALNPNTPVDILEKLSADEDSLIRYGVAGNPNTPVDILEKLSADKDSYVRQAIALNPNTPVNVLTKLSADNDYNVLVNITNNPNYLVELVEQLSTSKYFDIQQREQRNLLPPSAIPNLETSQESNFSNQQFGLENLFKAEVQQPSSSSKIHVPINPPLSYNIPNVAIPQESNSSDQQFQNSFNTQYLKKNKPVSSKTGTPSEVQLDLFSSPELSQQLSRQFSFATNNSDIPEIPKPKEARINLNSPLNSIKSSFNKILGTSKKLFTLISGKIKKRSDDIKTDKKEKCDKESEKPKKSKLQKKVESIWESIIGFLKDIVKAIIQYKLLEWMSNPENIKKFTRIIRFLSGVIQLFVNIGKFITNAFLSSIGSLTTGINFIVDIIKGIISILDTVNNFMADIGLNPLLQLFEYIPILFEGLVDFFTKTLPQAFALEQPAAAAEIPTEEESTPNNKSNEGKADGIKKDTENEIQKRKSEEERKNKSSNSEQNTKIVNGVEIVELRRMNVPPGLNSEQTTPTRMAKGGIVQKPTPALIGEAGPEAIIPLSNITNSSLGINNEELSNTTSKIVPEFTKLLLLPFKVIGAGIISTVQGIANEYPSIMPLIGNEISTIANVFGVPKTIVNVATKDFGKIDLNNLNNFNETENILTLFGQSPKINESTTNSDQNSENETQFRKQNDDSVRGLLGDILNALIYKNSKKNTSPPLSPGGSPPGSPPELISQISKNLDSNFSPAMSSGILNPATALDKKFYEDTTTEKGIATGIAKSHGDATYTVAETTGVSQTGSGWDIRKGKTNLLDARGRPVVLSQDAATDFDAMVSSSNNYVKSTDITSSRRSKEHNDSLENSSVTSKHLVGEALDVDMYTTTALWMLKYGHLYNWYYMSHDDSTRYIHFEYRPNQAKSSSNIIRSSLPNEDKYALKNNINKYLAYYKGNTSPRFDLYNPVPRNANPLVLKESYNTANNTADSINTILLEPAVNNSTYNNSTGKFASESFPNIPDIFRNPHAA